MKKIHLLTTAAVLLVSLSSPNFAASRTHRSSNDANSVRTYSDQNAAAYPSYSPYDAYGQSDTYHAGGNLPYPDRPWGAPDRD